MAAEVYAKAPADKKSSTHPGIRIPIDTQSIRPQYHGSCAALMKSSCGPGPCKEARENSSREGSLDAKEEKGQEEKEALIQSEAILAWAVRVPPKAFTAKWRPPFLPLTRRANPIRNA